MMRQLKRKGRELLFLLGTACADSSFFHSICRKKGESKMRKRIMKRVLIWVVLITLVLSTTELSASSSGDSVSILMIGNSLTMRKNNTTVKHL